MGDPALSETLTMPVIRIPAAVLSVMHKRFTCDPRKALGTLEYLSLAPSPAPDTAVLIGYAGSRCAWVALSVPGGIGAPILLPAAAVKYALENTGKRDAAEFQIDAPGAVTIDGKSFPPETDLPPRDFSRIIPRTDVSGTEFPALAAKDMAAFGELAHALYAFPPSSAAPVLYRQGGEPNIPVAVGFPGEMRHGVTGAFGVATPIRADRTLTRPVWL